MAGHPLSEKNRPIFVVGSPRSGTSILTWCLGQHSNILVQEESDWIGPFAINVAVAFQSGTRRGIRSQLGSLGVRQEDFFAQFGDAITGLVLRHRDNSEKLAREQAMALGDESLVAPQFKVARSDCDPKSRWIDGTPEYSFYLCALRKLFPHSAFLHIVRDVRSVVQSMLGFSGDGEPLVTNEDEAYDYWLRAAGACYAAERAYGSQVVRRLRYADLVSDPTAAVSAILEFLGEPFETACAEPLQRRINSSGETGDHHSSNPETQNLIDQAKRLEGLLFSTGDNLEPSSEMALEVESGFDEQVAYASSLRKEYKKERERVAALKKKIEELKQRSPSRRTALPLWLARKRAKN